MEYSNVNEFAETLTDNQLLCREMGHQWQPKTVHKEGRDYLRVLACRRCKSTRTQRINNRGVPVGNKYTNPDGYVAKGLGRLDQDDRGKIRLASLRRLMGGDD